VGAFGNNRTWIAELAIGPGETGSSQKKLDVFYEARTPYLSNSRWDDVDLAFRPAFALASRAKSGGPPTLLIGRVLEAGLSPFLIADTERCSDPIVVDLNTRTVRSALPPPALLEQPRLHAARRPGVHFGH
jgi:hypothetical protein